MRFPVKKNEYKNQYLHVLRITLRNKLKIPLNLNNKNIAQKTENQRLTNVKKKTNYTYELTVN